MQPKSAVLGFFSSWNSCRTIKYRCYQFIDKGTWLPKGFCCEAMSRRAKLRPFELCFLPSECLGKRVFLIGWNIFHYLLSLYLVWRLLFMFYISMEPLLFWSLLGQSFILGTSALVCGPFFPLLSLSRFCSIDHECLMGGGRVKPTRIYFVCQTSSL